MVFYTVILIGLFLSISHRKVLSAKIYAIIIALIAIFRYGCGADYYSYYYLYNKIQPSFALEITEPSITQEIGFRLLTVPFKFFNAPYQIYIAVFAIVSVYFIYKTCVKYSDNPTLSLVIYFTCYYIYWTYSSLRQGTALVIGIYFLLEAIFKKKEANFIIITLLLVALHESVLVLLAFYYVSKLKMTKRTLFVFFGIAFAFSFIPLGSIINKLAEQIPIMARVAFYVDAPSTTIRSFLDFQTIGRLAFILVAFLFYDSYSKRSNEDRRIMNIYIFSFVIYFIFKFSELTAGRLAVYGKILDVIILANIISTIKIKWNSYLYISFLIMIMFFYMYKDLNAMEMQASLIDNHELFTPYVNIFNREQYVFATNYVDAIYGTYP